MAILWVFNFEYRPNLLLGATGLVVMAYFFGQRAGIEIIKQKKDHRRVGVKYGFLTLIMGIIIGSTLAFM